jgi:UDP-N-acetylglucosamine--N-acetylmuramyl-(pentapeptide) pyrophosphoryl-undecaprenol N-acetylglucosamine transferase
MSTTKIFISGGGTGGHIFPGIAIAHWLKKQEAQVEVVFIGSRLGLEKQIIPNAGYSLKLVSCAQMNDVRSPLKKLWAILQLGFGVLQSLVLLIKHRPRYVLGVGGYVSVPMMVASSLLKVPRGIWEPNAIPGSANRLLSKWVPTAFLVFEDSKKYLKCKNYFVFGMPIRPDIEEKLAAQNIANLQAGRDKFHVFHYGGSQGAKSVGEVLSKMILKYSTQLKDFRFVHQCGPKELERFKASYQTVSDLVECYSFIDDMPKYYQWADVVIARGGASTLNELAAYAKPSIVIPLPLADSHQEKNAQALVEKNAAIMILQKNLNEESLFECIMDLAKNQNRRDSLGESIKKFYRPHAAKAIAQEILK